MEKIKFSTNWNGAKLNCNVFSTIRMVARPVGTIVLVEPAKSIGIEPFEAEVIKVIPFKLHELLDGMAYLDTGYNADETRKIIVTMYRNKYPDWESREYYWMLLRKVKP